MGNKKGFSFIELIIVISIIGIITVFGISAFSDTIDSMKYNTKLSEISGEISYLDNKVQNREIFDYEIIFEKIKNYYLINENIYDLDVSLKFDNYNETTGIGKISFSGANSGTGKIKYYKDYKFQKSEILAYNNTFTGSFTNAQNYKIAGTYSGTILNNIYFKNFGNNLKLVRIDTNINAYSNLDKISIKNILGKKKFGDLDSINKIFLTFVDELGKIYKLELIK